MVRVRWPVLVYVVFQLVNCLPLAPILIAGPSALGLIGWALTLVAMLYGVAGSILLLIGRRPGLPLSCIALVLQLIWVQWGALFIGARSFVVLHFWFGKTDASGTPHVVGFNVAALFWLIWLWLATRRKEPAPQTPAQA
jgi:hypothetical protein